MNRLQKIAWFNLVIIALTIIITSAAVAIEFQIRGYSTIAPGFVVILALLRLKPFLFKKPQGQDKVISDERDDLIIKRAASAAHTSFWWVFFISSFLSFLVIGPKSSVPIITLPLMAFGGALFMKIVCSVAILVQYGWGGKDGTE
jgi:hypothetical protein